MQKKLKKRVTPSKKAVALKYDHDKNHAPVVCAQGHGLVAERIQEIAQRYGIPLYRDDDLVEVLAQVELNREIPSELYAAVAQVLAWIMQANQEFQIRE
ncbi:MAG: EscU/YscU/HrcU family type III secretion system export apparatus switch protein [Chitinivibrionales bacterium]|nr:EscU/YscU/HrcU family type III secretion system export apparatus switch protein [Chitinivibrionales bacterium]